MTDCCSYAINDSKLCGDKVSAIFLAPLIALIGKMTIFGMGAARLSEQM
jgi:hypothetical protein